MKTIKTTKWVETAKVSEIISQARHAGATCYVIQDWMQDSETAGMVAPVFVAFEGSQEMAEELGLVEKVETVEVETVETTEVVKVVKGDVVLVEIGGTVVKAEVVGSGSKQIRLQVVGDSKVRYLPRQVALSMIRGKVNSQPRLRLVG